MNETHPPLVGKSARIEVRRVEQSDLESVLSCHRDNTEWLAPWSPLPMPDVSDRDLLGKSIDKAIEEWRNDESYRAGIFVGAELIGRISLTMVARGNFQNAYCGYWIAAHMAGRGIMPEALRLALDFAFSVLNLHRIQFAIMPHNVNSLRVMEKLGLRREGRCERYLQIGGQWMDHWIYAVTAEEWALIRRVTE